MITSSTSRSGALTIRSSASSDAPLRPSPVALSGPRAVRRPRRILHALEMDACVGPGVKLQDSRQAVEDVFPGTD